jgi:hypothetical protein
MFLRSSLYNKSWHLYLKSFKKNNVEQKPYIEYNNYSTRSLTYTVRNTPVIHKVLNS